MPKWAVFHRCAHMQTTSNQPLPAGYRLQDYRIDSVLNGGGFSYVYLAHDECSRMVAIKEYLPAALALRPTGAEVVPSSADNLAAFRHGMKCFFEEGRALASIDHPNILRVLNFFRANNTVYMVMRYEPGASLQEHIRRHAAPVPERMVRRLFGQLLGGLREVHTYKLLHLDIKPANIQIRHNGTPVLLDFGSARQALTEEEPALSPSYTPGYAAPEQYFDRKALGPWSDIYSAGASLYACLTRSPPPAADLRCRHDTLAPAVEIGDRVYSGRLLEIIDWCMQLDPLRRPQSVFSLQKALLERVSHPPRKPSLLSAIRKRLAGMGGS